MRLNRCATSATVCSNRDALPMLRQKKLGAGVIMSSDKTVVFTPRGIDPKSMSISRECPNCRATHTAYDVTTPTGQRLATKEHMSRKGAIVTQRTMYDNALLRECIIDIFSS